MQVGIELGHAPGRSAARRSHLRYEETPAFEGQEIVSDAGLGRAGGEEKSRMPSVGHIKEEDAVLPAQQTEQAAAGKDVVVSREMAVVRLIADVARRRNGTVPITFP
jgi:hypothetical protein